MSAALRWIAVLPGSLLAAVLARAILGPLNMLTMEDSALGLYWGGFFNGAVWVFAMTVAGSWIAPARKIETGAILAGLFLLVALVASAALAITDPLFVSEDLSDPVTWGEAFGVVAVVVYVLLQARRGATPLG